MLKNLLALLLAKFYSKEESGLVARQAMPSDQPVNIASKTTISSWGTIATFTAPGDGYVTFHGRSMAGAAAQIASLPLENNPTVITATQDNYQGMACTLPVQKGKTVEVYGSNIENTVVTFNRLIGGGYNRSTVFSFGKGENLCLKSLSPCSLIVSLRTNPSGLGVKHTLQGGLAYQLGLSNMSLQRTVGWGSISPIPAQEHLLTSLRMGQMGTLSQEKLWPSLLPQVTLLSLASCLLRRATGLSLVVLSMSFGSHQQWGANSNLSTGGALC